MERQNNIKLKEIHNTGNKWLYMDDNNIIRGPISSLILKHWIKRNWIPMDVPIKKLNDIKFHSLWSKKDEILNENIPNNNNNIPEINSINKNNNNNWYYIDIQFGMIRGPFNANDMKQWYKMGYFVKHLPVKKENETFFIPISERNPKPEFCI